MYAYIKGILAQANPTAVIIEAGGIGYKIFIPISAMNQLPQVGETIILHLSFIVREQAQTLYGFPSMQERDFFESLMGVTGIGPKIALALIGHMPLGELQKAIAQQDIPTICRVPGIGKKGAERLIIEMRDKISNIEMGPQNYAVTNASDPRTQCVNDAMSALINLGYTNSTAQTAIKKSLKSLPESIDVASLISLALKHV